MAQNNNTYIQAGLRADLMRQSIENKNSLSTKGALYVGTGELVGDSTQQICKTKAFHIPANSNGKVLTCENNNLTYKLLQNNHFDPNIKYPLESTFQSFPVTSASSFKEENFSNLKLQDSNFQPGVAYPNLWNTGGTIVGPWYTRLTLRMSSEGYMTISCSSQASHFMCYSLICKGCQNATLNVSNMTLIFSVISYQMSTVSRTSVIKQYIEKSGGTVTISSTGKWYGYAMPTLMWEEDSSAQLNLQKRPIYFQGTSDPDDFYMAFIVDGSTTKGGISYRSVQVTMSETELF